MAEKKKSHTSPPKSLTFPADWDALGAAAGVLRAARAAEHRRRMNEAATSKRKPK